MICSPARAAMQGASPDAVSPASAETSLEGWPAETFGLPPGFAPELPSGHESLRFAPGWRTPETEEFWSYAFVMWIDEPEPDAARIDALLEGYYNGLMTVFARNKDRDISDTPVRVDVTRVWQNRFEAEMHLIDAFATFEPIDLHVKVKTAAASDTHSMIQIRVSPQPETHRIWADLQFAIDTILAEDAAPPMRAHADTPGQLAGLSHIVSGTWQLGLTNGYFQHDTWQWGPGGHSLLGRTINSRGDGESTSGVCRVIYWHPGEQQLRMLAISRGGLVWQGPVRLENGEARFDGTLFYPDEPKRDLHLRWTFDSSDSYVAAFSESLPGRPTPVPLATWEYARLAPDAPPHGAVPTFQPVPARYLAPLDHLLGRAWQALLERPDKGPLDIELAVSWITHTEAAHARISTSGADSVFLLDAYLFYHPGSKSLRCLALTQDEGLYEGAVSEDGDGGLLFRLTRYVGEQETPLTVRLQLAEDHTLRASITEASDAERTVVFQPRSTPSKVDAD